MAPLNPRREENPHNMDFQLNNLSLSHDYQLDPLLDPEINFDWDIAEPQYRDDLFDPTPLDEIFGNMFGSTRQINVPSYPEGSDLGVIGRPGEDSRYFLPRHNLAIITQNN